MGHSHAWSPVIIPVPSEGLRIIREILDQGYDAHIIQYDKDDSTRPVVTAQYIRFNGIGADGYSPFFFQCHRSSDTYCKTYKKPYDRYVMLVLIALKHFLGNEFTFRTDGTLNEWKEPLEYMAENYEILDVFVPQEP